MATLRQSSNTTTVRPHCSVTSSLAGQLPWQRRKAVRPIGVSPRPLCFAGRAGEWELAAGLPACLSFSASGGAPAEKGSFGRRASGTRRSTRTAGRRADRPRSFLFPSPQLSPPFSTIRRSPPLSISPLPHRQLQLSDGECRKRQKNDRGKERKRRHTQTTHHVLSSTTIVLR